MDTEEKITTEINAFYDSTGDGIEEVIPLAGDTLFPSNGNNVTITITLKYSDGSPAPGISVSCWSEPKTLTGSDWRQVNQLASRFGRGAGTIRQRVSQGIVRLSTKVTPAKTNTNSNGQASFRLDSFHICGNDSNPASDLIIVESRAGRETYTIKSAVEGLSALQDNESAGLTTSGLVGRHLHTQVISILKNIGGAWQNVGGKPAEMPNFIVVTGASMKWGGLNPPHMTHRFGGTSDIRPIGTKGGSVSVGDSHYHREATGIIIDFMKQTGATEIRFADNLPGVTTVDSKHKNHIHVSWLRKPTEPWFVEPEIKDVDLKSLMQSLT